MNALMIQLALGSVSTPVLAVIEQPWWPKWLRVVVAYVLTLGAGAYVAYHLGQLHMPTGPWDAATIVGNIVAVAVASQATYPSVRKTGLLDAIEHGTDVSRIPRVGLRSPVVVEHASDTPATRPVHATLTLGSIPVETPAPIAADAAPIAPASVTPVAPPTEPTP